MVCTNGVYARSYCCYLRIKTLHFFRSRINSVGPNRAFSTQVSLTLIWVEHPTATSMSRFNCTCTVSMLILLTVYAGRVIWQETDLFHPCCWVKAWYIILDHGACVRRIEKSTQRVMERLWPPHTRGDLLHLKTDWLHNYIHLEVRSIIPTD